MKGSKEHGAACVNVYYVGNGLRREEILSYERYSDWSEGFRIRTSEDNGSTWSDWKLYPVVHLFQSGHSKEEAPVNSCYDPVSKKHIQFLFQRITIGKGEEAIAKYFETGEQTFFDHNFWQISEDDGLTWGEPHLLKYEEGRDFDPANWGQEEYLRANQMYGGYAAVATREGTVVYPSCGVPMEITDRGEKEKGWGLFCFIGKWDPAGKTYRWKLSEPIYVPRRVSGRGLMEPVIAELLDGRLLLMMRGSNHVFPPDPKVTVENGGHKWMSFSKDGGYTWSPVTDFRYDTGEQFYSPSAFARLLRHSRTQKLYCFLNISPSPTRGNEPRYPLYIAEVDEAIPALRKSTLTVIDDRNPNSDTEQVQFSNFSLFENRETGEMELYLTRYGERNNVFAADSYKYTITLRE
jgi:hypothetical protein